VKDTPHGFTIAVREVVAGDDASEAPPFLKRACLGVDVLWVELRFNRPPTPEWEAIARGILTRMSCSRPVEIHGPCQSHAPTIVEAVMTEALNALAPPKS
jgi:hypothetical protein